MDGCSRPKSLDQPRVQRAWDKVLAVEIEGRLDGMSNAAIDDAIVALQRGESVADGFAMNVPSPGHCLATPQLKDLWW
jgi:hypothetical protein